MSSINWFHLLESAKLKLLSLRNIPNLKEEFNSQNKEFIMYPIATITDVKIYHSYLPIIDDYFFLFKLLKSIEQLELNSCSISFIKNSIFDKVKLVVFGIENFRIWLLLRYSLKIVYSHVSTFATSVVD